MEIISFGRDSSIIRKENLIDTVLKFCHSTPRCSSCILRARCNSTKRLVTEWTTTELKDAIRSIGGVDD